MKEWMCWTLLIIGVILIGWLAWWVTMSLDALTVIYITIALNFILSVYLIYQGYDKKK